MKQEPWVITDAWKHEDSTIYRGMCLGTSIVGTRIDEQVGVLASYDGIEQDCTLREYRGEIEKWYDDEGRVHTYFAGVELLKDDESLDLAFNMTFVELSSTAHICPLVFSSSRLPHIRFQMLIVERLVNNVAELPIFVSRRQAAQSRVRSLFKGITPTFVRAAYRSPDTAKPDAKIPKKQWIPFNRVGNLETWYECRGAFSERHGGGVTANIITIDDVPPLVKGTCLGNAVDSPRGRVAVVGRVVDYDGPHLFPVSVQ
jgi:hypothetical protein